MLPLFITGCGNTTGNNTSNTATTQTSPITLTLYSITEDSTTPEAIAVVEEALNKITQSKYNINLVLKLYTEDEYDEKIDEIFKGIYERIAAEEAADEARREAQRLAREAGQTYVEETTEPPETKPSFVIDRETGKRLTVYPDVGENQIDIFLVRGFEDFKNYILNEDIASIDEALNNSCKKLKSYINPTFFTAVKESGLTYAVPNNNIIGEYEYLFLNKEMVDKYSYYPDDLKDLVSISDYLNAVAKYEPDYVPFAGDITAPVEYITQKESYLGIYNNDMSTSGIRANYKPVAATPSNLLLSSNYISWLYTYEDLKKDSIIDLKADVNGKVGAKIVKGDCTISPTYADVYGKYKVDEKSGLKYYTDEKGVDYYVTVYKAPTANNSNMYQSLYCVSSYTANVERCMNILLELNTSSEMRNLMQYGVKDVNYEISEKTGKVNILNNSYSMNPLYTGNILILDECENWDDSLKLLAENKWEKLKNHNLESIVSPLLGFYYNPLEIPEYVPPENDTDLVTMDIDKLLKDVYLDIEEQSAEIKKSIEEFEPELDEQGKEVKGLRDFITTQGGILNNNKYMQSVVNEYGAYNLAKVYTSWFAVQFK